VVTGQMARGETGPHASPTISKSRCHRRDLDTRAAWTSSTSGKALRRAVSSRVASGVVASSSASPRWRRAAVARQVLEDIPLEPEGLPQGLEGLALGERSACAGRRGDLPSPREISERGARGLFTEEHDHAQRSRHWLTARPG